MPTLLPIEGYRFCFFSDERKEPPHVQVRKGSSVPKLWLRPIESDRLREELARLTFGD